MFGRKEYIFNINLTSEKLLDIYKGIYRRIQVVSSEGLTLEIDVNHIKQFTTHNGIHGSFKLTTSAENKFIKIEKIS